MEHIFIINRDTVLLEFSFNGEDIDGRLEVADGSEARDDIDESRIWIRGVGGEVTTKAVTN